jgi:uncharacterized SAM-binding protein YcdF (DUF218 family)
MRTTSHPSMAGDPSSGRAEPHPGVVAPHRAPVIIVLGARVQEGGRPGAALRSRVERAVELYRAGAAPLLLFTGGALAHAPSEASVARALAVELGVPEKACLVEEESRSTSENARHSARLLRERGITEAVIVSSPFHLYRARQSFRREGIDALPVAAPIEGRDFTVWSRAWWTTREVVALLRRPSLFFTRRPKR